MSDFVIAGSGLTGSVIAHELNKYKIKCLIVDKRPHIAGNIYTKKMHGIDIHQYGPHIFHTNSKRIWDYVSDFSRFNNYRHKVKAISNGKLYTLPFNLQTIYELTGVYDPDQALSKLTIPKIASPQNLEEYAKSTVGIEIYETLIKGYTRKQWNREPNALPTNIIKRIPWRLDFDDRYYNHIYEGIPVNGYTEMIENMQEGIKKILSFEIKNDNWKKLGKRLIYTGPIDSYYDYCYGKLDYRSLEFENQIFETEYKQGCAQINYSDYCVPYTRTIEHKHFNKITSNHTIITYEYPAELEKTGERYYPIEDTKQLDLYKTYRKLNTGVIFAGRLGNYAYYDMDQAIAAALKLARMIIKGLI